MAFLGVDIGTSGCKAAAFDVAGRMLSGARRAYAVESPAPGWMELDSMYVMHRCFEVISEAASKAGEPIQAIGISSQGEAFTPVDEKGEALGNAMVSSDCRASDLTQEFISSFGLERLYGITGHTPSPLFSLFKMLWLKQNRPEVWSKAARFLCFEDLLQQHLGVEPAMGWPLAGRTMLFDIRNHCWSKEILAALELDERKLARPLKSGSMAGEVSDAIAYGLGLPHGVRVVTGGHDQTIAALGAGVCEEGDAMYAAGSVECICPVFSKATLSAELCQNNLCCYDYSLPGNYCSVAYSLTGSNLLQYLMEQFGQHEAELSQKGEGDAYELLLRQLPDEPTRLLALSYFTPSGTPYFDAKTPGAILGLRLTTSKGEIFKSLLEAVALEMKLNLSLLERSGIKTERLFATGGGSRSLKLLQMKADVLNMPITKLDVDEAGCFGAAMLAASAVAETSLKDAVLAAHREAEVVKPDPERARLYAKKFEQYKEFYSGMKSLSGRLLEMESGD